MKAFVNRPWSNRRLSWHLSYWFGIVAGGLLSAACLPAAQLELSNLGQPFSSASAEVRWSIAPEDLPRQARVLRTVSSTLSPAFIQHLLDLAGLTAADRVPGRVVGVSSGAMVFRDSLTNRVLTISPLQGSLRFIDREGLAQASNDPADLPEDEEVVQWGLRLLPQLGIPEDELAKDADGQMKCTVEMTQPAPLDLLQQNLTATIPRKSVRYYRTLEGITASGSQGVYMDFGNEGRLATLDIHWDTIQRDKARRTVGKRQLTQWLREGRAVVESRPVPGARLVQNADVQKLNITQISVTYDFQDTRNLQTLYPVAVLTAEATLVRKRSEQITLYCPLITDGLPKARRPRYASFWVSPTSKTAVTSESAENAN